MASPAAKILATYPVKKVFNDFVPRPIDAEMNQIEPQKFTF